MEWTTVETVLSVGLGAAGLLITLQQVNMSRISKKLKEASDKGAILQKLKHIETENIRQDKELGELRAANDKQTEQIMELMKGMK